MPYVWLFAVEIWTRANDFDLLDVFVMIKLDPDLALGNLSSGLCCGFQIVLIQSTLLY